MKIFFKTSIKKGLGHLEKCFIFEISDYDVLTQTGIFLENV
jgi:hypothetical protein